MRVWQSVKAKEGTPQAGNAGTVQAVDQDKPDECVVKFDNGVTASVQVADLEILSF